MLHFHYSVALKINFWKFSTRIPAVAKTADCSFACSMLRHLCCITYTVQLWEVREFKPNCDFLLVSLSASFNSIASSVSSGSIVDRVLEFDSLSCSWSHDLYCHRSLRQLGQGWESSPWWKIDRFVWISDCSRPLRLRRKGKDSIKACPHCRRKVRQSPNFAVVSPFSATVALFCDSLTNCLRQCWQGLRVEDVNGNVLK